MGSRIRVVIEDFEKMALGILFPRGKIPAIDAENIGAIQGDYKEERKRLTIVGYSDNRLPECVSFDDKVIQIYLREYQGIQMKSIEGYGDTNTSLVIVQRKTEIPGNLENAIDTACSHHIDFRLAPSRKEFFLAYDPNQYILTVYNSMPEHLKHPHQIINKVDF